MKTNNYLFQLSSKVTDFVIFLLQTALMFEKDVLITFDMEHAYLQTLIVHSLKVSFELHFLEKYQYLGKLYRPYTIGVSKFQTVVAGYANNLTKRQMSNCSTRAPGYFT